MGRPPVIPVEKKTRIVLSILAGEMTIAEAARREKAGCAVNGRFWSTRTANQSCEVLSGKWRAETPTETQTARNHLRSVFG